MNATANAPANAPANSPAAPSLSRKLKRLALGLVVLVLVLAMLPVVYVPMAAREALSVRPGWFPEGAGQARIPAEPAGPAIDASMTPQAAGDALRRVLGTRNPGERVIVRSEPDPVRPWEDTIATGLFPSARIATTSQIDTKRLIAASRGRLTAAERARLAASASAPIWRDWDALARAQSIDILGATVELPFGEHATLVELPILKLGVMQGMARGTVERAAHFLVNNRRDSAEAAIRATVAIARLLEREGTNYLDILIGRRMGEAALTAWNHLNGDTTTVTLPRFRADSVSPTFEEVRASLLAQATDSTLLRGIRIEALFTVGFSPCASARELVFGVRDDTRQTFATARRQMTRFPSDSAMFELLENASSRSADVHSPGMKSWVMRELAHLSSTVFFSKRIHACSEMMEYAGML